MKIFNWVHRKFHHNSNGYMLSHKNDVLGYDVKKPAETTAVTNEADTEALLLDQVTDLIDVWKDGILTIGTFGYDDPLKPSGQKTYYSGEIEEDDEDDNDDNDNEEHEEEEEEEEGRLAFEIVEEDQDGRRRQATKHRQERRLNPLVVKAFKREIEKVLGSSTEMAGTKTHTVSISVDETDMPLLPFFESPEVLMMKSESEEKKKRMTLADLFSAEPNHVAGKSDSGEVAVTVAGKKPACHAKNNGLSLAKKLMPRKGEDSRPIRKLQRMITKMLKKKIHPLEGKVQGKEGSSVPSACCTQKSSDGNVTVESVSLLREVVAQC